MVKLIIPEQTVAPLTKTIFFLCSVFTVHASFHCFLLQTRPHKNMAVNNLLIMIYLYGRGISKNLRFLRITRKIRQGFYRSLLVTTVPVGTTRTVRDPQQTSNLGIKHEYSHAREIFWCLAS